MRVGSTSRPTLTIPRSAGRRHGWRPPYALPNAGEVVSISTNFASDVTPAGIDGSSNWNYAVFGYYGGGALVEDYSVGGAYVIAGSGGHAVPPNVGAAIFDFADATWKQMNNANSVPYQATDFLASEIDSTFGEVIADNPAGCPAPAHLYGNLTQLRSSQGGGPKGSFLRLRGTSAATDSSRGSNHAHAFNLATGLWTRLSTNGATSDLICRMMAHDAVSRRYYMPSYTLNDGGPMDYLDETDWTWKTTGFAAGANLGTSYSVFVDQARRVMVAHTSGGQLRGFDLDNLGDGPTTLTVSGSLPGIDHLWHLYPADGCYYTFDGLTTTTTLHKLRPPNVDLDPLASTWAYSTVTLGTALTKQPQDWIDSGAVHNTRFFFVPSINCFCWMPGDAAGSTTPVVVLKPPA